MARSPLTAFLIGAGAGALVGGVAWWAASRRLDRSLATGSSELAQTLGIGQEQLRAELEAGRQQLRQDVVAQVQAQVPSAIDQQLALYGITPSLIRNLEEVLDYGRRAGVLS